MTRSSKNSDPKRLLGPAPSPSSLLLPPPGGKHGAARTLPAIAFALLALSSGLAMPQLGAARADEMPSARPGAPSSPTGHWLLEDIHGGGVLGRVRSTLDLTAAGRVSGSGGCNRFTGTAEITGADITFLPLAMTRMACPPAVMQQEGRFMAALNEVRRWQLDPQKRKLHLLGADGNRLLTFAAF